MKISCCPESYLGIPQKAFETLISTRVLTEGDHIPCLHCASLYEIHNFQLEFLTRLSKDVYISIMKKIANDIYDKMSTKSLDDEVKDIYNEFKGMQL